MFTEKVISEFPPKAVTHKSGTGSAIKWDNDSCNNFLLKYTDFGIGA
jgi:hypothetical protein